MDSTEYYATVITWPATALGSLKLITMQLSTGRVQRLSALGYQSHMVRLDTDILVPFASCKTSRMCVHKYTHAFSQNFQAYSYSNRGMHWNIFTVFIMNF